MTRSSPVFRPNVKLRRIRARRREQMGSFFPAARPRAASLAPSVQFTFCTSGKILLAKRASTGSLREPRGAQRSASSSFRKPRLFKRKKLREQRSWSFLAGGTTRIRTGDSRICSPLPYHLAMVPYYTLLFPREALLRGEMERATRFELATSTLARWRSAK